MRRALWISSLLAVAFAVSSCREKEGPDEAYENFEGWGLVEKGQVRLAYDPQTWQHGFCRETKQYHLCNDSMTEFCTVSFSEFPRVEGQILSCALRWTEDGKIREINRATFKVTRADPDGTVHLWCGEKRHRAGLSIHIPQ